nr:aldo/keto reductase [Gloeocapsopsis sp. IPPAS B-1203]
MARDLEVTPNQVVLASMMQGTPAIIPIIAASILQQLQENLDAQQVVLSSEQIERLTFATE